MDQKALPTIPGYLQAVNSAALFRQPENCLLKIEGEDQIAFLQRQTTNDLRNLTPDHSLLTVLTSPTARILDVLRVIKQENSLAVITLPGNRQRTLRYLQSRIFFMDKVKIQDETETITQFHLFGPASEKILESMLSSLPDKDEAKKFSDPAMGDVICVNLGNLPLAGFLLLGSTEKTEILTHQLNELGANSISPEVYEVLRIEAGLPQSGSELTEEYTPLETSLDFAISSSKGCYTGQEVIARQITYDKITRSLVGLKMQGSPQVGDPILVNGQPVGSLTSQTLSPRFGQIGLAVIKRPYNITGQSVVIKHDGGDLTALVVDLPFAA